MIERLLDWITVWLYRLLGPAITLAHKVLDRMPRPLDPFRSIKLKLSILLGLAGATGLVVFWLGVGFIDWKTAIAGAVVGLATLQIFAHGMTKPLREMTSAARRMARGDYTLRVRATSRDEVGELAEAFNHMAADLEAVDERRRELVANVAHELRTPITALQGVLENLVDGVSQPDPTTLKTALAQTERLARLVEELLDLSKVDAGGVPLKIEEFDLKMFLADALSSATLSNPTVHFVLDDSAAPATIKADPARLHQVFANLLDNAARHSPHGGIVTVSANRGPNVTVFDVADRGTGIPPSQRDRVFERFFTDSSRGTPGGTDGGTGLGLAIARWVVGLHHGTIAIVDATDGIGCRVRITLPALEDPDDHPSAASRSAD